MSPTRPRVMQSTGTMALGAAMIANAPKLAGAAPKSDSFNIDEFFAAFMRGIGGTASDGGGKVASRAKTRLFAVISALGQAWPFRRWPLASAPPASGRSAPVKGWTPDDAEVIYNTMPALGLVLNAKQRLGKVAMDDPLPGTFTWMPTINGRNVQAPLLFGNPLSFTIFETKDRRQVTPTGLYPRHFGGFLSIIGAAPNRELVTERHSTPTNLVRDDIMVFARGGWSEGWLIDRNN